MEYPTTDRWLPEYVRNALDGEEATPITEVFDYLVYGDKNAEQVDESTPEDRLVLVRWHHLGQEPRWYLNAYSVIQEYGGPEEGGWHFYRHVPILLSGTWLSFIGGYGPEGYAKCEEMMDAVRMMAESSTEPGEEISLEIEFHQSRVTPKHRPHYC